MTNETESYIHRIMLDATLDYLGGTEWESTYCVYTTILTRLPRFLLFSYGDNLI